MSFTETVKSPTSHSFDFALNGVWRFQPLQEDLFPKQRDQLELGSGPTSPVEAPWKELQPLERMVADAVVYPGPQTKAEHEEKNMEVRRAYYMSKACPPARPLSKLQHQLYEALDIEADRRALGDAPWQELQPHERMMANAVMYSGPQTNSEHEDKNEEVRRAHYMAKAYPPPMPLTRLQHQLYEALDIEADRRGFGEDHVLLCPPIEAEERAYMLEKLYLEHLAEVALQRLARNKTLAPYTDLSHQQGLADKERCAALMSLCATAPGAPTPLTEFEVSLFASDACEQRCIEMWKSGSGQGLPHAVLT